MTSKDVIVTAEFQSKSPHTTSWLEIGYHVEASPTQLLEDLAAVGWGTDGLADASPLPNGRTETHLVKQGSALFGGWTHDEQVDNMRAARAVLRRHKLRATSRRLSLADLL